MKKNDFKFKQPNFIPLLDVFFVILIFFLYVFVILSPESKLDLKLPTLIDNSKRSPLDRGSVLHISLYKNGEIKLQNKVITFEKLESFLKENCRCDSLVVEADRDILFSHLIKVLKILQKAGIKKISFAYLSK